MYRYITQWHSLQLYAEVQYIQSQCKVTCLIKRDVPAVLFKTLGLISAVEEFTLKELHCNNREDEHEEDVNNEDVENILQRVDNTVEHGLKKHRHGLTDVSDTTVSLFRH